MDYRKRGSHARGVYPTQDTSYTETVRMKQEEEDRRTIVKRGVRNNKGRNVGTIRRKSPRKGLTSAKDLTI